MDLVKKIINEWDPIELLCHAPDEEYDLEVEEIAQLLKQTEDSSELARGIHTIFTRSFGPNIFNKSIGECRYIADALLRGGQGDG